MNVGNTDTVFNIQYGRNFLVAYLQHLGPVMIWFTELILQVNELILDVLRQ